MRPQPIQPKACHCDCSNVVQTHNLRRGRDMSLRLSCDPCGMSPRLSHRPIRGLLDTSLRLSRRGPDQDTLEHVTVTASTPTKSMIIMEGEICHCDYLVDRRACHCDCRVASSGLSGYVTATIWTGPRPVQPGVCHRDYCSVVQVHDRKRVRHVTTTVW